MPSARFDRPVFLLQPIPLLVPAVVPATAPAVREAGLTNVRCFLTFSSPYVLSPVSASSAHGMSKDAGWLRPSSFDIFLRLVGEGRLRTYGRGAMPYVHFGRSSSEKSCTLILSAPSFLRTASRTSYGCSSLGTAAAKR